MPKLSSTRVNAADLRTYGVDGDVRDRDMGQVDSTGHSTEVGAGNELEAGNPSHTPMKRRQSRHKGTEKARR